MTDRMDACIHQFKPVPLVVTGPGLNPNPVVAICELCGERLGKIAPVPQHGPVAGRYTLDEEVSEAIILKALNDLAAGPVGQMLLALAEGRSQVVAIQSRTTEGYVLRVVPMEEFYAEKPVPLRPAAVDHDRQVPTSSRPSPAAAPG